MFSVNDFLRQDALFFSVSVCLFVANVSCSTPPAGDPPKAAAPVYDENFNYESADNNTFNSWIWRADGTGQHYFVVRDGEGCSKEKPCLKLTSEPNKKPLPSCASDEECKRLYPFDPVTCRTTHGRSTKVCVRYSNAEMYHNSCCRQDTGRPEEQEIDRLKKNAWAGWLFSAPIVAACDEPYRDYVKDSWNRTMQCRLEPNRLPINNVFEHPGLFFKDLALNNPIEYGTLVVRAKAINEGKIYYGSRGWGFWNTQTNLLESQYAWFIELFGDPPGGDYGFAGVYAFTQGVGHDSKKRICWAKLDVNMYEWQDYRIQWNRRAVVYFVGDRMVHQEIRAVPTKPMAFHNWVDNAVFWYSEADEGRDTLLHITHELDKPKVNLISRLTLSPPLQEEETRELAGAQDSTDDCVELPETPGMAPH